MVKKKKQKLFTASANNQKAARAASNTLANNERHERKDAIKKGEGEVNVGQVLPPAARQKALECITAVSDPQQQKEPSFAVGTQHVMRTNLTNLSLFGSPRLQQYIIHEIQERVGDKLLPNTFVKIVRLDTNHGAIVYTIVDQPPTLSTDDTVFAIDESGVVYVDAFEFPNSTSMRGHPAIIKHDRLFGRAMVQLLRDEQLLFDDLTKAPRVVPGKTNITSGGVYRQVRLRDTNLGLIEGNIIIVKTGWADNFLDRLRYYESQSPGTILLIVFDFLSLDYNTDMSLQVIYNERAEAIRNDLEVSSKLVRLFCEKFVDLGGDRYGWKDDTVGRMIECALQRENGEAVVAEHIQYDENYQFGMVDKVLEADEACAPIIESVGIMGCDCQSSWAPAQKKNSLFAKTGDDGLYYNTPSALGYCGTPHDPSKDAYDGAAKPDATTVAERWSTKYSSSQDIVAEKRIDASIAKDGLMLLDSNKHNAKKMKYNMKDKLTNVGYSLSVSIYGDDQISLFINQEKLSAKTLHPPPCIAGDIRTKVFTLNHLGQGCMVIDTMRLMVLRAKGKSIVGPMLAIEAAMAQRLLINGLRQNEFMRGLILREYIAPGEGALDKYGGNASGPIRHNPFYPMAKNNKYQYRKHI